MSQTYSIFSPPIDATRQGSLLGVLNSLPNNDAKVISPKNLRDSLYTIHEICSIKETTISGSTFSYLGFDRSDIINKIYLGKKQLLGSNIMTDAFLSSATFSDIYIYNNKYDNDLSNQDTIISFLAGVSPSAFLAAPYLQAQSTSGRIDLILTNPADSGIITMSSSQFMVNSTTTINNSLIVGSRIGTLGLYSASVGSHDTSDGTYSLAVGRHCQVDGTSAAAVGDTLTVIGNESFAQGNGSFVYGIASSAFGSNHNINGNVSFCAGENNTTYNTFVTAFGYGNTASGTYSLVMGFHSQASGLASISDGGSIANGDYSHASGVSSVTDHYGEWSKNTTSDSSSQYGSIYYSTLSTTGNSSTEMFLDSSSLNRFTIPYSSGQTVGYNIRIYTVALASGGDMASFYGKGIVRNINGTVSFGVTPISMAQSSSDSSLVSSSVIIIADNTTKSLKVNVIGVTASVRWATRIDYEKIIF
jgi:hypothetical protein